MLLYSIFLFNLPFINAYVTDQKLNIDCCLPTMIHNNYPQPKIIVVSIRKHFNINFLLFKLHSIF